ncbi:MAG: heme o synthase [Verrucomicrobiota bacterium]|nr:heme o synthase [Verrucomicrobiota bacterium]
MQAPSATSAVQAESKASPRDYLELTKPRLSGLSVTTALVGYLIARPPWNFLEIFSLLLGTALAAGGVAALNQWIESETYARMRRTADRPIPAGRVPTGSAFVLGALLCAGGLGVLFVKNNGVCALLALLTYVFYLAIYTPAKKWSRWSTEIGAVAGALPPLIGAAAADGGISPLGWMLFGVLFFWQIPHFMAIAWTYRRDYAAVNFPMLPVLDESGAYVARWSFLNAVLLAAVSLLPAISGWCSEYYLGAALALNAWLLWRAAAFLRPATRDEAARKLFWCSITYLPLLLGTLLADRLIFH